MEKFSYSPPDGLPELLSETTDFLAVNKPSGLLSNPGMAPTTQDCALSRLQQQYGQLWLVHRLDCDTSGILLLARNKAAESQLKKQLQLRQMAKCYEALVQGVPAQAAGVIDQPLGPQPGNPPYQHVCPDGRPAQTRYEQLAHYDDRTRLALYPATGRTHQLRVHLAWLGHPILGDRFYGVADSAGRLCLHARELRFRAPDGTTVTIKCPPPF